MVHKFPIVGLAYSLMKGSWIYDRYSHSDIAENRVFWGATCRLLIVYRHFEKSYCLYLQSLAYEEWSISKFSWTWTTPGLFDREGEDIMILWYVGNSLSVDITWYRLMKVKVIGKVHTNTGHEGPEGEQMYEYSSTFPSTSALDGVVGQPHAPVASSQGRPGNHCIGGWVDPWPGLDGCGRSRFHRDSIPGPSSPYRVAIPPAPSWAPPPPNIV
jgi:hypothetical protein